MLNRANIKNILRDIRRSIFCRKKENNISDYKYFIFINSKVINIIDQIYPFFEKGFLDKNKVLIIYKYHFENAKKIQNDIKNYNLNAHCLINLRDIPTVNKGSFWIYTHNSMYNYAVINKNLDSIHMWLGHGDSDKIAYYKKLIRVYDYIFVTGDMAIQRFLKHNIFKEKDKDRFIRIGKAALCSILPNKNSVTKDAILFAPTWEGAMVNENYSTLHLYNEIYKFIKIIKNKLQINNIVIKLHPNTGIREFKQLQFAIETIRLILKLDINIIFIAQENDWIYKNVNKEFNKKISFVDKLFLLKEYNFVVAITNISAMASMCVSENIKTFVLYDSLMEIQNSVAIDFAEKVDLRNLKKDYDYKLKIPKGIITYEKKHWQNNESIILEELENIL